MAIPKKYKKTIKNSYRSESPKRKMTWSFNVGDLVDLKGDCCLILETRADGYFRVSGPFGIRWAKGKDMATIQKSNKTN